MKVLKIVWNIWKIFCYILTAAFIGGFIALKTGAVSIEEAAENAKKLYHL